MTVTDESYADDRATVLLRMVQDSSVTLHVVANKLPENPELLQDIKDKLTAHRHGTVLSLPLVNGRTAEERLGYLMATAEAETLRQTIAGRVTSDGRSLTGISGDAGTGTSRALQATATFHRL